MQTKQQTTQTTTQPTTQDIALSVETIQLLIKLYGSRDTHQIIRMNLNNVR